MKCAFASLFLCFALAFASAQVELSPPLPSPPEAPESSWQTLDSLLTRLSDEALNLTADSEMLKASLAEARLQLIALSARLDESRTEASGLSSSLERSALSLATLDASLREAERRRGLELWLWRGGAGLGLAVALLALIR